MGLDRDELAARFAAALLTREGYGADLPRAVVYDAFRIADEFIDAQTHLVAAPALSPPAAVAPATPAPEAKRPGWVRATGPATADHVAGGLVTIGKVYKVEGWVEDGSPRVIGDRGLLVALSRPDGSDCGVYSKWEPCDAPAPTPPAPSREEACDHLGAVLRIAKYYAMVDSDLDVCRKARAFLAAMKGV